MPLTLDLTDDWQIIDWLQTISYISRTDDASDAEAVSCQALKREDSKGDMTGSGGSNYADHTADWELWLGAMATAFVPKQGDRFTATGTSGEKTWLVDSVDYCDRTTRYRLHCRQSDEGA